MLTTKLKSSYHTKNQFISDAMQYQFVMMFLTVLKISNISLLEIWTVIQHIHGMDKAIYIITGVNGRT
jgi:hypothetical protein